jgi:uncharacterized protein YcbX
VANSLVSGVFRYPVKSMLGEALDQTDLGEAGVPGDRHWAIRDEQRGGIRGGKKLPRLMKFGAVSGAGAPTITSPDGETKSASEDDINNWLSAKLEHPVSLWPLLPKEQLEHYRRGPPDDEDFEAELRAVFGRLPHEPIPDLTPFIEVLEYESPPGTYFDAFPLMLMSKQSLETMEKNNPGSQFDIRRFRPNLLIDCLGDDHPFPEQQWVGKQLLIGEVVLDIAYTCPRCSMVTQPLEELPQDAGIMRALVEQAEGNLGVYARVVQSGTVSVGDSVSVRVETQV